MLNKGDKIGEYVLVEKVGSGGFGDVWKAEKRTVLDVNYFALKFFRPKDNQLDFDKIGKELAVWKQLRGLGNIISVIELDRFQDYVYVVSDFADGGSLESWLTSHGGKAPTEEAAIHATHDILIGLENLHDKGFVHRDLKPDNILIMNGKFCLADFGVSREIKTHSKATGTAGTVEFMPPEAFEKNPPVTAQTDIWAVGVILQKLLTGDLAFPHEMPALMLAIIQDDPEPMPESVPLGLREIVKKALQKKREDRFQTAREMRNALQNPAQFLAANDKKETGTIIDENFDQEAEKATKIFNAGARECPICQKTYSSEYSFCLEDGTLLIEQSKAQSQDWQAIEAEKQRQAEQTRLQREAEEKQRQEAIERERERQWRETEAEKERQRVRQQQEAEAKHRQNLSQVTQLRSNYQPPPKKTNLKWIFGVLGGAGLLFIGVPVVFIIIVVLFSNPKPPTNTSNKNSVFNNTTINIKSANNRPANNTNRPENAVNTATNANNAISSDTYFDIAYKCGEKKDHDCAIRNYNKVIELDPSNSAAYNNRGIAYADKYDYDAAIRDYNKAIELKSDYANAYNNRGIAYDNKKNYDQALRDYNKAIELKPDYANAYNNRGVTYENKGDYVQAIADYRKALQLDPNQKSAKENLEGVLKKKGK
jgi:serine/threonine protein kinase